MKNAQSFKTRTVLFVEQTWDGKLAKSIREVLARLEPLLGFRIKVTERSGMSLRNNFPNTNPWAGAHCSRMDCITCNQNAELAINCTKRSLVYENICLLCNPEADKKQELVLVNKDVPSVYVGETARSIQERSKEHWDGYKSKDKDNHIYKHWILHHQGEGEPRFVMRVVQFHRSALSRQVGEAIRISRRGVVLNSRGEFNRCKISRLSLEQVIKEQDNEQFGDMGEEDLDKDWTEKMLKDRDMVDRECRQALGRVNIKVASKRGVQDKKGGKKHKYARLEEWGLHEVNKNTFLNSGLEGVTRRLDTKSRPRPKASKAEKDLERAAVGTRNITDWMNKEVPATVFFKYPYCPKQMEAIEWSGTGLMFLDYFPTEEFEPIDEYKSVKVEDVCGTAPVQEDTAVVRCVKEVEGYVDMVDMGVKNLKNDVKNKKNEVTRNKAVKVWVKLRSGLFGWRTRRTAMRRAKNLEQSTPLTLAENFVIGVKNEKNNIQVKQIKRKFDSGGVLGESESNKKKDCDLEREDYAEERTAAKKLRTT